MWPTCGGRHDRGFLHAVRNFLIGLGLLLVAAAAAHAEPEAARHANESGQMLYDLQRFDEALAMFERAYEERPDPALLFDIAQCQRQLGRYRAAARSYRSYLARASDDAPNRDLAAAYARDASLLDRPPIPEHEHAYLPWESALHVPRPLPASPPALTAVVSPPMPVHHWYRSAAGWTLLATGALGISVAAGLLIHASALDHQLAHVMSIEQLDDLRSGRDSYRLGGYITISVGGALLAAGIVTMGVASRTR